MTISAVGAKSAGGPSPDGKLQPLMDAAVRYLVGKYSPRGNRAGWLMMASIIIEAWDFYGYAFVLVFLRDDLHPSPLALGLAGAATQGGALLGSLLGGFLSDRIGRRAVFTLNMVLFIIVAVCQGFVPNIAALIAIRFVLGLPLGSDIASGYTYIMDALPKGQREVMGNRWQFMFAVGEVLTLGVIALFIVFSVDHSVLWRVILAMGALPALLILVMRHSIPETAVWLIRRGRFKEAKDVSRQMYGDSLDMLPDQDHPVVRPKLSEFVAHLRSDRTRLRASLAGYIQGVCQATEFTTFAFYLPVLFVSIGVSSILGTTLVTMALYAFAAVSGWIAPLMLAKIGHRGVSTWGFGIVFVSLLAAAAAIYLQYTWVVPLAAAGVLWGHYWDASNVVTIPTMVARPEFRGIASGVAYAVQKLPSFFAIFLFPTMFAAIGQAAATLFVAIFPLVGFLSARFLLPEVYGYDKD